MGISKIKKDSKARQAKITINSLRDMYNQDEKIVVTTAYDYTMAKIFDDAGVDALLVGDSLGMVVQGGDDTLGVEVEHMIYHTRCVAKAASRAHVIADMPFLSYQVSFEEAIRNAGELIKAGADSVKMEGGEEISDLILYLTEIGIPVMAHIGLKPQHVRSMGGYKIQGKSKAEAEELIAEAQIMEDVGAYALLLEGVPLEVAKEITESVQIPTIGISSGSHCSGQVLVSYDLLGANPEFKPRFVRRYFDFYGEVKKAVEHYSQDVRKGNFPNESESFHRNLVEVKPAQK